jgi:hypothetical protein
MQLAPVPEIRHGATNAGRFKSLSHGKVASFGDDDDEPAVVPVRMKTQVR